MLTLRLPSSRFACVAWLLLAAAGLFPCTLRAQIIEAIPTAGTVASPSAAMAQDTHAVLIDAWDAYKDGHVEQAEQLYEQLLDQAPEDPHLLYNLGTAYAKQGKNGLAAWSYLQALRLAPRDRDTRANLQLVAPDIFEQTAFSPFPPLNMVYGRLNMNEWTLVAGACSGLLLLIGTGYMARPHGSRLRTPLRSLAWVAGVAALLTWPLALSKFYQDEMVWKGVVIGKETVAHAGPDERQTETFSLPEGSLVLIERAEAQDWLRISYAGGKKVGFIRRDQTRFL